MKKNIILYFLYFLSFCSLCYGIYFNNYRIMFLCMFTLFLFLLFDFLVLLFNVKVSYHIRISIFLFLFCSEILGEAYNFYSIVPYWDDILHFVFGCIVSYLSFLFFNRFVKVISFNLVFISLSL